MRIEAVFLEFIFSTCLLSLFCFPFFFFVIQRKKKKTHSQKAVPLFFVSFGTRPFDAIGGLPPLLHGSCSGAFACYVLFKQVVRRCTSILRSTEKKVRTLWDECVSVCVSPSACVSRIGRGVNEFPQTVAASVSSTLIPCFSFCLQTLVSRLV